MDKCNYPLDGICPCLKETQLCLCTAEISGTQFSLSKEKFRGEKKLQQFGKAFVKVEVLFSKMPPVSSVVQGRNWTHPRSSCPLLILSPAVQRLPKGFSPFSCTLPLSSCFCGLFPVLLSPISLGNQLQPQKGERNPYPALKGSWKAAQEWLSSPCPDRSVDSLWELFPSNISRVYLPLSASPGSRMCSQIWFMVLPALILSRLSSCFSLSKQVVSFQPYWAELRNHFFLNLSWLEVWESGFIS